MKRPPDDLLKIAEITNTVNQLVNATLSSRLH